MINDPVDEIRKFNEKFEQIKDDSMIPEIINKLTSFLTKIERITEKDKDVLRKFFDLTSSWIISNISSVNLSSVISLITIVLEKIGHRANLSLEGNFLGHV